MGQTIETHVEQNNFLSGVMDARASGRADAGAYLSSMLQGTNIEIVHLGGVQRRRGLVQKLVVPNQLTQLTGTYTAPNGGNTTTLAQHWYGPRAPGGSLPATTVTTTPPNTTDPWVVCHVDLGSAQNVLFADAVGLQLGTGGSSTQFQIQYSNNDSTWTTLGTAFPQVDSTAPWTYRRTGGVTFPQTYTNARYWRLVKIGGTNLTVELTLTAFTLFGDAGVFGNSRLIPFEVSTTEQYMLVVSDRSGIVIDQNGNILDYIALPYSGTAAGNQVPSIDAQSTAESMMVVHQLYPPQFIVRVSSPLATGVANQTYYNFQTFLAIFSGVPQVDYADSSSPTPTSDIQTLTFNSNWNVGDTFTITIQNDTTGAITYLGDNQNTANSIATAVQALWVVNGFTGVSCVSNGSFGYTLTFANDAAAAIGNIAITSLSSNATATTSESQVGSTRQEPAWSPTRGYPGTVTFFEGRMYMGGLLAQQETVVGSWVNNILNFSTEQGLDDQALYVTLTGVGLNAINALFPGKSLCVFTSGGEFRFNNDANTAITPASFPTNQTQYGVAKIKPVMIDGNIVFVQRNLNSVRDFQFDYTQDQFNSLGLSSFAGPIVYNVKDMAAWNGSFNEEINLVFVVNGANTTGTARINPNPYPSGTCAVYNTRKEASVQAWVIWSTPGITGSDGFTNVGVIVQSVFFLTTRNFPSGPQQVLEQAVEGACMDCGTGQVFTHGVTQATGVTWLNGVTCRVVADNIVLDNVTVSGGVVPFTRGGIPYTVQSFYEVGLNYTPLITPMPLQTKRWPAGSNLAHKKRIVATRCKVSNTLGLYYFLNANTYKGVPEAPKPFPTTFIDNANFDSIPVPYDGILEMEDACVWDQNVDKTITFTQLDPLPFYLMYVDMALSGEQ